tara:strand:+ start:10560 stop:11435 length:876 start_codon:yes stop_codon:yes gene_type:complete
MTNFKDIILGHNSLFGINHLDNEIGRKKLITKFSDLNKVKDIINFSFENNLKNLMISTVDETKFLIPKLNEDKKLKDGLGLFILLPYINKYVRKTNELGIIGAMKDALSQQSIFEKFKISYDIMKFLSNTNYKEIIPLLIKFEMSPFKNSFIKSVILHDSLTDILVSLGRHDIINFYCEFIKKNYSCTPGFATKNLISFLKLVDEQKIGDISILTHINKIGYEMNPNQKNVEEAIKKTKNNIICMSILASGYLNINEGLDYVKKQNINNNLSTVIGCSSEKHILEYVKKVS